MRRSSGFLDSRSDVGTGGVRATQRQRRDRVHARRDTGCVAEPSRRETFVPRLGGARGRHPDRGRNGRGRWSCGQIAKSVVSRKETAVLMGSATLYHCGAMDPRARSERHRMPSLWRSSPSWRSGRCFPYVTRPLLRRSLPPRAADLSPPDLRGACSGTRETRSRSRPLVLVSA